MAHHTIQGTVAPIGPYSPALCAGNTLYLSGQIPLRPDGRIETDLDAACTLVLENIRSLLTVAGFTPADVVKTTVYLTDLSHFPRLNEIYGRFFTAPFPARTTVEVSRLPKGAVLEIDAVAVRG